jgi:UDP-2,3-diacylglucosamine pyrophosphatase LpxH
MAMGDGPVIVVSDTHFGFECKTRERFRNFLNWLTTSERKILTLSGEGRTLEAPLRIILLGDSLEYWVPRYANASLAFRDGFDSFKSLFASFPEIVYVAGNHDHVIGDYAGKYVFENGFRLLVFPDHYPGYRSAKPGKKYKGTQIGGKTYFFLHGHQFDFFGFPALLNFGDFMAENSEKSRNFKWLTRAGAVLLVISLLVAHWLPPLSIWLADLLKSAPLLSFPVTAALVLWGFFVFLGVLWVFGVLGLLYYEYTNHLGQVRRRPKRRKQAQSSKQLARHLEPILNRLRREPPSINIQQLINRGYYKAGKDTIDADIIVFGHTHVPGISRAEDNGTHKSFLNSGSWIEYADRPFDTFIYIDRDGSLLLQWDNVEKSVRELAAL